MSHFPSRPGIRVASIPASQVYIRHLEEEEPARTPRVLRLPDPPPLSGAPSVQSAWWPPAMLSAGWVHANHRDFDVMHIHFGFDAAGPKQLRALLAQLRRFGKPLVYTVHDLRNPHQHNAAVHRELLDVLIPNADQLITLTAGAAREIEQRWGVAARVLPHPHVVDFDTMDRIRARRAPHGVVRTATPRRVGVHLKGLRPNMDPGILEPLARVVARLPFTVLQVNIHAQPLDPEHAEYRPALATALYEGAAAGAWDLRSHEYFSEPQLIAYLASLDACVLPYRFGTHSGWLEAALDVGTPVAAPDCGYYAGQHPSVAGFHLTTDGVDEESLFRAVDGLLRTGTLPGSDAPARREQRGVLARAHREIYASLLGRD